MTDPLTPPPNHLADGPAGLTRRAVVAGGLSLAAGALPLLRPRRAAAQASLGNEPEYVDPRLDDELFPINVRQNWGLMNQSGRIIVLPTLRWTDEGHGGLARFQLGESTRFMVGNGDLAFNGAYPYADRFAEDYAIVGDGEKLGYIDRLGNLRARPQFDDALRFSDGFAAVRLDRRCGYLDQRFKPAIPLQYREARSFFDGLAAVQIPVGEPEPDRPAPDGSGVVRGGDTDYRVAFIDKRGEAVFTEPSGRVRELGDFCDGFARFRLDNDKWGYLDRRFKPVIEAKYDDARDFYNGSAAVRVGEKWGYIDKSGSMTVQPRYDYADDFDDTLAMVVRDGKFGFIGRTGKEEIEPQYEWAEPFRLGLARVSIGDSFGYIQVSGRLLWDPRLTDRGILDKTSREAIKRLGNDTLIANQRLQPPPPREPMDPPYPPDYLYDPVLRAPVDETKRPL